MAGYRTKRIRSRVRDAQASLLAVALLCATAAAAEGTRFSVDLEALSAWQGRNDVEVPNDGSATRFALDGLTGRGPYVTPRLQLSGTLAPRHEWRVLLAPLSITEDGQSVRPISFQGQTFAAGSVNAHYRFDSWRATWRYLWINREDLRVKIGFTAKVRDASIRLRQGSRSASKDNTGFVPLLHASIERPLSGKWGLEADIDALGGGPGYAVDAGARLVRQIDDEWSVQAGWRFLDGGADNDEVYAFARFTSVGLGVRWTPR
ncbi:MAG: hypothetical protein ACO3CV_07705 [Steroidobacteraceae bacterium]